MGTLRQWIEKLLAPRLKAPTLCIRSSDPGGWSFETRPGSGYVNIIIRSDDGKLLHSQTLGTARLSEIVRAAQEATGVADIFEPTILPLSRHPIDNPDRDRFPVARPKLTLLRVH